MRFNVQKAAQAEKMAVTDTDMAAINAQTMTALTPEEVFVFRVAACDDQVDRDNECFPRETLEKLAPMFVGRTVICDHRWSAANQQARIYKAEVRQDGNVARLIVDCYMLRTAANQDTIAAINGGILREVSVGCTVARRVCSICGADARKCPHFRGMEYEGQKCHYKLMDPIDAYELSFVAVPAQREAGVIKKSAENNSGWTAAELDQAKARLQLENERWKI